MGSIKKAFKKVVKVATGGLVGGNNKGQSAPESVTPAPDVGTNTEQTELDTEKQETESSSARKRRKKGKSSLRINSSVNTSGGSGLNVV